MAPSDFDRNAGRSNEWYDGSIPVVDGVITPINGRKCMGNWCYSYSHSYNPIPLGFPTDL